MSATVTAEASHAFGDLDADSVYAAWTDATVMRRWMEVHLAERHPGERVTRVEVDARIGGRFDLADTREDSAAWGSFRELERPRRVVFTWFVSVEEEEEDNSTVSIDIVPDGAGCRATIRHKMSAEWADYLDRTAEAWRSMLAAIGSASRK